MLRRKTPNGILAAAYDGTSVEEIVKPPAMKHILLPVTVEDPYSSSQSGFAYHGQQQELPLRSPGMQSHSQMPSLNMSGSATWSADNSLGYGASDAWKMTSHFGLPQIDSMLNQIPANYSQLPHPLMFNNGIMPPSLQSPLGPTVSNDQGPIGPYWPNGTFVPYRPAALRDARYYSNAPSSWAPHPHDGYSAGDPRLDWQTANGAMNMSMPQLNQMQQFGGYNAMTSFNQVYSSPNQTPVDNFGPRMFHGADPVVLPSPYRNSLIGPQGQSHPQLSYGFPSPGTFQDTYSPIDTSGQATPRALQSPVSSPLPDFGPCSSNAQLRERVFTWAHSIYVDLLKYLQHSRRHNHQNRLGSHHSGRPNIYPKPPQQPSANFASPQLENRRVSSEDGPQRRVSIPTTSSRDGSSSNPPSQINVGSHNGPSSAWPSSATDFGRQSQIAWTKHHSDPNIPTLLNSRVADKYRTLRRTSGSIISGGLAGSGFDVSPAASAVSAVEMLTKLCNESSWQWIDGMLLVGCLAYALNDFNKALDWYSKILDVDANHVEATSNLAATLLALDRKQDAEQYWRRAVKHRPGYFEAVEHLVGLLCGEHRTRDAVAIIEEVERALRYSKGGDGFKPNQEEDGERATSVTPSVSEHSDKPVFEYEGDNDAGFNAARDLPGADQPGFGISGYAIPGCDNGRMLALVHAKGNMLYSLGSNMAAAKAFENAVMIGAGRTVQGGISGLIKLILTVITREVVDPAVDGANMHEPILLLPDLALQTAKWCFASRGELPGLQHIAEGIARKAAVSTTSNSLLSLAKIFQDGMANSHSRSAVCQSNFGVREILALYYLSLALQPSPSTANNVGILLASVQQAVPLKKKTLHTHNERHRLPGVPADSGVALALEYYHYGLGLDPRHAHLYTNLGSLLKDVGHLDAAIQMYEQAVTCDGNFDIALANLANAVKDKGRISDAINYYRRAVSANPDFAEAICGLANALNSVCGWAGRGGIASEGGTRDRWHVNDKGMLLDSRNPGAVSSGWIKKVVNLVEKQLADGEDWGKGSIDQTFVRDMIRQIRLCEFQPQEQRTIEDSLISALKTWTGQKWEGARIVRLAERAIRQLSWQWYQDKYVKKKQRPMEVYRRPQLPASLTIPAAPTVLPFHTFTCPMSAKQIRLISQRNGLRISTTTLKSSWLPATVFPPPAPPNPFLKVGYVSSDFNNHPLAHLMQSVFGLHDTAKVKAFCYATTASDNSVHRQQIEKEAPVFYDASNWSTERLVGQIVRDGIHILVNLNGYTRGARNEVFAARPAPIQMSFMGFAGTLGAEWCDYLLADETAIPLDTLRPWRRNVSIEDQLVDENSGGDQEEWVYGENIVYCKDTFFCCDHRQSAPDVHEPQLNWEDEQIRRWKMRKEIFPNLPDDVIILGNFNQLYKVSQALSPSRCWLWNVTD